MMAMGGGELIVHAAEENLTNIGMGTDSGSSEVIYDTADKQEFTVMIPKKIVLGSDKTGSYDITVKGDVAQGSEVTVKPQDAVSDKDGINFVMTSTKSGGSKNVDVIQNDVLWNYSDIAANDHNGTQKNGEINGSELTFGIWNGTLTFRISFKDEYGPGADEIGEITDWQYTLDNTNNTVTLTKYISSNQNVVIYPYYKTNDKLYSTRLPGLTRDMMQGNTNIRSFTMKPGVNTSNVHEIGRMFKDCSNIRSIDLSNFNTENVDDMAETFRNCTSLTSLNLSGLNTSKVLTMDQMFRNSRVATLDLSSFNTAKCSEMESMFEDCTSLRTIYVGSAWHTGSSTRNMFVNCGTNHLNII